MENEELESQAQELQESAPQEKMLSQSEVNEIVKREKLNAENRARKELEAQMRQSQPQQSRNIGGIEQPNEEQMYNKFRDKLMSEVEEQRKQEEYEAHKAKMAEVADNYYSKMSRGKELFDDFDDVVQDFSPQAFPQIVFLASQLENTPEVIYELAKHGQKLAGIDYLAKTNPKLAERELQKLSKSISNNQNIQQNTVTPNSPLSRTKPSNVGTSNGNMSLRDLKKAPWLRG